VGFIVGIFLVPAPSFLALLLTMSSLPTSPCAIVQILRVRYYESRYYGIGHLAIHNLPPGGTTGSTIQGNWTLPERIYQKLESRGNLTAVEAPLSLL